VRNILEIVSSNEKIEQLGNALSSLSELCRHIVILRTLNGLSQKEVATRVGIYLQPPVSWKMSPTCEG
jgi:DNA-directed RNA polymerase specialized sigma24 family protein